MKSNLRVSGYRHIKSGPRAHKTRDLLAACRVRKENYRNRALKRSPETHQSEISLFVHFHFLFRGFTSLQYQFPFRFPRQPPPPTRRIPPLPCHRKAHKNFLQQHKCSFLHRPTPRAEWHASDFSLLGRPTMMCVRLANTTQLSPPALDSSNLQITPHPRSRPDVYNFDVFLFSCVFGSHPQPFFTPHRAYKTSSVVRCSRRSESVHIFLVITRCARSRTGWRDGGEWVVGKLSVREARKHFLLTFPPCDLPKLRFFSISTPTQRRAHGWKLRKLTQTPVRCFSRPGGREALELVSFSMAGIAMYAFAFKSLLEPSSKLLAGGSGRGHSRKLFSSLFTPISENCDDSVDFRGHSSEYLCE